MRERESNKENERGVSDVGFFALVAFGMCDILEILSVFKGILKVSVRYLKIMCIARKLR